jgi:4-methoxybenzoate monooxygenase (O-demethylating)
MQEQIIEGHFAIPAPHGVRSWDIDPYDLSVLRDPVDYYAELRAKGPFVYLPKYAALAVGRYAETREVFSEWQRFVSSRGVGLTDFSIGTPWRSPSIVLEVDPPYHTRTRAVLTRVLSPRIIARLKDDFSAAAEKLIDRLLEHGEFDGVADFAEVFPTTVFPRAVGLRDSDPRLLLDYGEMVFNSLGPDNTLRRASLTEAETVVPWITRQCERALLHVDGIGAEIYVAADTGEITEQEASLLVRSLLSAGIDTTVAGIGNAVWCLANAPEQFARLTAEPALARNAFEEALRLTSPVHTFCRTTNGDTTVGEIAIAASTKILCVLGAANLDPAQWDEPMRFDITRKVIGHLGFGVGIHACVGQMLARAEGEAVLSALARKVAALEPTGPAQWRPNNAIRTLECLPLTMRAV